MRQGLWERRRKTRRIFIALMLLLTACDPTPGPDEASVATSTSTSITSSTTIATTTTTEPDPFVYRVGLTEPPTTDNFWAFFDPQSSLADRFVLGVTKPSLYALDPPGFDLAPYVATTDDVPAPVEGVDGWEVTVDLVPDAAWSDGVPLTADDIVFTFETVRSVDLGAGWRSVLPVVAKDSDQLGVTDVAAIDADTVRFTFNGRPGLPLWPNAVGLAPIMPRHQWEPVVAEALASTDPALSLITASGAGDPSGGPIVIDEASGSSISASPNPHWLRTGQHIDSDGVTYELGPFFEQMTWTVYAGQADAATALAEGTIDIILDANGLEPGVAAELGGTDGVTRIDNQVNGFRYLAFNLRRIPLNNSAFRQAIELMNDRDRITTQVFGMSAFSALTSVPSGNTAWFNHEVVAELAAPIESLTLEERLDQATRLLADAGFSWEDPPRFVNGGVSSGSGVALNGEPVRPLEILAPSASLDPLRSTYALWVGQWLEELGFTVDVVLTDFASIVNRVFTPSADGTDIDFDMVILGWRLPSPGIPLHHNSFWSSINDTLTNDGNNNTGFSDARFDAFAQEYSAATDAQDAYEILWEMEKVIYETKPYVILFGVDIAEAYRDDQIRFPSTDILSGVQSVAGMPEAVKPAEEE